MQKSENPLIVQGDRSILLDVHAPGAPEARNALLPFAELEKSPEHLHTYRLTPLSLWNAAGAGFSPQEVLAVLERFSRYPVPPHLSAWVSETMSRFGKITLEENPENRPDGGGQGDFLFLRTAEERVFREIAAAKSAAKYLFPLPDSSGFRLARLQRGTVKQELLRLGWPVRDLVPLREGAPLETALRKQTLSGAPLVVRDYQEEAAQCFVGGKGPGTGFGVIVLPCGAGKTIAALRVMEMLQTETLVLTANTVAVRQWIAEIQDKTTLPAGSTGEYTGARKEIKPVTVATYQILTWRAGPDEDFPHFNLFRARNWGLIIYDEVHLLPAPVFRITAELQAVRRLGLTATLVREDGLEKDVFSLVGPKRFDVPWKELEAKGWIASVRCVEIRVPLSGGLEYDYASVPLRGKHRIAGENPRKTGIVAELVQRHAGGQILIIGQYLDQLAKIAARLHVPQITGKTPEAGRESLYADFRSGKEKILVVSKVANFAVDLPDASVAIQVSGSFGSRQEEAQRLGRILRPKDREAVFYTLVSDRTVEEDFAANRQKFLAEQGYAYSIVREGEFLS